SRALLAFPTRRSSDLFVEFLRLHVAQQLAVAILVGAVERLHQHLDGAPDLIAEGVGHLVLVLQRALEERRKPVLRGREEAAHARSEEHTSELQSRENL